VRLWTLLQTTADLDIAEEHKALESLKENFSFSIEMIETLSALKQKWEKS